ncbi:DUF2058 domain-containing protein [Pseudoalteromonas tunicata]|jgi:uncharacterized protein YaiL (DUF2058 family)|uniref:Nucleoprotein/polynucleotide-associated enzyme n=1 Tax=Pseudoalteromonas tunicata D2 TaxID=87626 RepID=A4C825_9GAMM|nr:DUF2058 domain-containing protein [Pseudoalteromonas tunicata]ATC93246.1 hypothetical protein PTUN_a0458 [Pseudoalteromonas tunicata]AXT32304.1 DUF2058 domain-containing protein [Pseudoalteromonas tunicata]EAR28740.1 hypothetical protein PTD2_06849 [Pseudoalteromonas tunicata D2]MDP4985360.1 DUF2058 domain-containing protein [Pseudoalteromonas tunicata]MDP5212794.1 DUF2058 domain-containing protein [Pseudoalteromonas tunicata]
MGSLQDQLLKSGLTTQHKMKVAKTEKRKQQQKQKKGATSNPSELAKHIEKTRQEQLKKAEDLNKAKLAEQKDKEQVARVKQILEHNNQDGIRGNVTFNFTYLNKIKELDVSPVTQKALAGGRLAICVFEDKFYVLEDGPARKIAEVDEKYIVFHVTSQEEKDQDDPYAEFEIPDDLIW